MAIRRRMLAAIILAGNLAGLAWTTGRADDQPPPPKPTEKKQSGEAIQEAGLVQTTCKYDTAMLVVVSKHGAAGVRFIDPFELGNKSGNGIVGVSYEWRFQGRKTGKKEQTGTGRVYAKLVDSNVRDGSFSVKCGPVHFTWSYKDKRLGVIQYNPRDLGVHPVALRHFAKIQAPPEVEAIDLRRFLQPKDARAFRTAGPVLYSKGVIVVRDANGIATFEFGKTIERRKGETQTLYGVPYHFTFLSPEGKTKEGDGEVYERYTNGKYDEGQLDLHAGPLQVHWSRGGAELGWIYYNPVKNPIWSVDKPFAESLVNAIATPASSPAGGL